LTHKSNKDLSYKFCFKVAIIITSPSVECKCEK